MNELVSLISEVMDELEGLTDNELRGICAGLIVGINRESSVEVTRMYRANAVSMRAALDARELS